MANNEAELDVGLAARETEALELRMGAGLPPADATTGQLLAALLGVRQRLDRMEALLADVLQLRAVAARQHTAVRIIVDDAWDQAAVGARNAGVRDEYSSAKERAAAANLQVLDERRLERVADRQLRRCDEAVEFIRLRLRGLQEVRQDILAVIKIRQFETAMER